MKTIACLLLLITLSGQPAYAKGKVNLKKYRNTKLGYEFLYPRKYKLAACGGVFRPHPCVGFDVVTGDNEPEVYVVMLPMGLEQALRDDANVLFEKVGGKWIKHGRGADSPTTPISRRGWRGLYAVSVCGISDEMGFHAAGGDCLSAVISKGRRTFLIESDGTVPPRQILNTIVRTFRMR
ncbi:MAG: hypothetical protein QOD32_3251 [Pyrinomonadaceae bacterium]|jgi:hypothetical protein|nr:hypothetical protein [Pyrinomonadaceae bacterium]